MEALCGDATQLKEDTLLAYLAMYVGSAGCVLADSGFLERIADHWPGT
jgi:hypothetical protein